MDIFVTKPYMIYFPLQGQTLQDKAGETLQTDVEELLCNTFFST